MKLPKPQQLPSGAWRIHVQVNGKRVAKTFPTENEALYWAAGIKTEEKQYANPSHLTLGKAMDKYIQAKDGVLAASTVAGYKRIRQHAFQDLMDKRLCDLRREDVQRAVSKMARTKSPKSVKNAFGLLTATVDMFYDDLRLKISLPQKQKPDIKVPSEAEIQQIIDAVHGYSVELPVLLALSLGLRMSEIRGLKWEDIEGDVLHIRRARVDEGEKTTKTYTSRRDLIMPGYIKELIVTRTKSGEYIVDISRRRIYDSFTRRLEKCGIQHFRFHDLRHANASVMMRLNVPDGYAKDRMGHATTNMLQTVYQHTMPEEQKKIASKVNDYFEAKMRKSVHENAHEKTQTM